jgi:hypothetical protein
MVVMSVILTFGRQRQEDWVLGQSGLLSKTLSQLSLQGNLREVFLFIAVCLSLKKLRTPTT